MIGAPGAGRAAPSDPRDAAIVSSLVDELPVAVWVARAPEGSFVYANRLFDEIFGIPARPEASVGEYAATYRIHTRSGEPYPEDGTPFLLAVRERASVTSDDLVIHRTDGRKVHVRAHARPLFGPDGEVTHVVVAFADITREAEAERARAETEARLSQAQKMQSIGNLAGGIAHDFNNLLAAIRIITGTLRRDEDDKGRLECFDQIEQAAASGVQLTRALLGFARRGKNLAARVAVNDVVISISKLAERSVDRRIEISRDVRATIEVVGDFSQLEQLLMNLIVNAKDAMPEGGRLTLRTYDHEIDDAAAARYPSLKAGPHVAVEVEDEGTGIEASIRDRIFEPYFTTKTGGPVKGVGLGLATAFGIVESHGGVIEIASSSRRGTTMRVLLPAAAGESTARRPASRQGRVEPGRGTVLVVDDETIVLRATATALRELGYDVLAESDGARAVATFRSHYDEIAVVLLDVVMPRMDGRAVYLALREIDPDVRVVLTTGYALNEEAQRLVDLGVRGFVAKPFDLAALSTALADAIQGPKRRGAARG